MPDGPDLPIGRAAPATPGPASQEAAPPRTSARQAARLLGSRRFGTFWIASLLSNIGTWAQQVAEPWLLLTLGASPFLIGLDAFALNAPALALTLAGGVLADRADRRRVILGFQSLQMLCPALLVVLVLAHRVRPAEVIALSLVVGITDALSMPAFQSILPSLVDRRLLGSAFALSSTQFNLARIAGPALAGALLATVGAVGCFAINTASYLPFILVALWILPRRVASSGGSLGLPKGHRSGYRELLGMPAVRGALATVFAGGALCGPLVTFCPVVVRDLFHRGGGSFGGALSAYGVGGLIAAAGLLAFEGRVDRRRVSAGAAVAWGGVVVLAGLCRSFPLLVALLVVGGVTMTMTNISANTCLQDLADEARRGETASLYLLAMRGGLSLGNLVTGATSGRLGMAGALLLDGALAVIVQLVIARRWLRRASSPPPAANGPPADGAAG